MKKVVFFNHWHNGDVHVSRGMVRQIMNKVQQQNPLIEFSYTHRNASDMLSDIPNLIYDADSINKLNAQDSVLIHADTVYINTWYDQQFQKFARQYGILTIDALYAALDAACQKIWNFSLGETSDNPENFFPIIDYSKLELSNIKSWLEKNNNRKVLVENGNSGSNQAHNFPMTPIIIEIAKSYPETIFILSCKDKLELPSNIVYTSDIIQKSGTDLNEISFLSTHCDMIIGRASGVFSFTITQDNLFKRKIKYLCFSHLMSHQDKFWIGKIFQDRVNYVSDIFITRESNTNKVLEIINKELKSSLFL